MSELGPALGGASPGSPASWAALPPRSRPRLSPVKILAALSILAMLTGKVIAPSAAGIAVGIDHWIDGLEFAAGITAQLLALGASITALSHLVAVARHPSPVWFRTGAILTGCVVVLIGLSAAGTRPHPVTLSAIGILAGVLAVAAAWDAMRSPIARIAGLVVGAAGMSTMIRLVGVALAEHAVEMNQPGAAAWARGVATVAFGFDFGLLFGGGTWMAARDKRVAAPLLLLSLGASLLLTRVAVARPDDPGAWALLVARGAERLLTRPEPYVPLAWDLFVAIGALCLAISALFVRSPVPALAGALSLALVVRSSAEVPLFGILLVVASAAVLLSTPRTRQPAPPSAPAAVPESPPEVETSAQRH